MLTMYECKDGESVKAPLWKRLISSNPNQKGTRVKKTEEDTKLGIEKIVMNPEYFESYYKIDYRNLPPEVWAILSQWEHEFLRGKFPEKLWTELDDDELSRHELEWKRIIKNASKWKLSVKQVKELQNMTPHMLANFAEIEWENVSHFSWFIRLGWWSKKALEEQTKQAA